MDSLRTVPRKQVPQGLACCRCGRAERCWDRIAGKAYCPNCQELLATGEGPLLVERTDKNRCAVCHKTGTVCFHSFPLQVAEVVAIDLCGDHLRSLIARRLGPFAFNQLRRKLQLVGVDVQEVFLLHDAFYDSQGRALQPAIDLG